MTQVRGQVKRLIDGRLQLPPEIPYVVPHNTWV
jgi:hypothetical protein